MRARLLRLAGVAGADWDRWTALARRAAEPNAELDPRFLGPERDTAHGRHLLLVAEEDDEWFGLLRVFPVDSPTVLDVRAYGTFEPSVLGSAHPLLDRDRTSDALETLARGLRRLLRSGYLVLRGYPGSGVLADALKGMSRRRALSSHVLRTHGAAWMNVVPEPASQTVEDRVYPAHIDPDWRSTSTRKKLRREARRLSEVWGAITVREAGDDPAAIDRFIEMQASGWKGDVDRDGYALALDPAREQVFRDKVARFRSTGDLIVLEFWAGETHAYSSVLLVSGGLAMGCLDAYHGAFEQYSVGTLARVATFEHLRHRSGIYAVNPAVYYFDSYAARTFPDEKELVDVIIGIGAIPSLLVASLPRAERSRRTRGAFDKLDRVDRFSMRAKDGLLRRLHLRR